MCEPTFEEWFENFAGEIARLNGEPVDFDAALWELKAPFVSRLSKAQIAEVMEDAGCAKSVIKAATKAPKAKAVNLAEKAMKEKSWLPALFRNAEASIDLDTGPTNN